MYNKSKIKKHSFFPFIYSELIFKKYNRNEPKRYKPKKRPICYSAHIDRLIFSYYSYQLNKKYNKVLSMKGIENAVVAYRTNLRKNNIHFAKEAFDFIIKTRKCHIMIGDFTSFFDKLNHKYLKKKLCEVLEVEKLEEDWYAVYKNITKYSKCDLSHLLEINGLKENEIRELNTRKVVLELEKFKLLKKEKKIKIDKNNKEVGIPQGSAISAVLSNVYMIDFDEAINNYVKKEEGLYLRYSDDFIVVFPNHKKIPTHEKFIKNEIKKIPDLKLEETKAQSYKYDEGRISGTKKEIDYLGFTFDGKEIRIRDKTVSKYYKRMYKKIKTITNANGISKDGKKITCVQLYEKYSIKGSSLEFKEKNKSLNIIKRRKGNFITYVKRAEKIFGILSEKVGEIRKNHMRKIRKRLKEIEN